MSPAVQTFFDADPVRLPRGRSQFTDLRNSGQIYIDKTDLIFQLARLKDQFFLSRPRGFGKTLLISTLESLFLYGTRDFKGLAIEKLWTDTTYDVLRLNFATLASFKTAEEFRSELYKQIRFFMLRHPVADDIALQADADPWSRFQTYLSLRPLSKLVVLIDEYDAPLTHCLGKQSLFNDVSVCLNQFYQILKDQGGALRFLFVTGICRFQHLGIFSAPNQITDISLKSKFGALLGYTADEIDRYFSGYISKAAESLGISCGECTAQLKFHYDGFCFDSKAQTHVFSPWSVLNFLSSPEDGFVNYWYNSGGSPTVLLQYIRDHGIKSPENYGRDWVVSVSNLLSSAEFDSLNDLSMLFHTGYLTIKGVSPSGNLVLNTSNNEVSTSLAALYADRCLKGRMLDTFAGILLNDDPEQLMSELNRFVQSLDYRDFKLQDESSVRSVLQLCMMAVGFNPKIEVHNHKGRSDLEVRADKRCFVFELKYHKEGSPDPDTLLCQAADQITCNHYGEQNCTNLAHIRIAMVFSQKERRFIRWKIF